MEGTEYYTGYDHARNGHYFDPPYRYTPKQRDDYRRGYSVGQELRIKEKLASPRRFFRG